MRGLKYFFTIPEGEKVTEKHLTRVLISSVCSILLCMSCLISTTWAWFAVSIENTGNVIEVGNYRVSTTVTRVSDREKFTPVSTYQHGYLLEEGEYTLEIELQEHSAAGYCEIYANQEKVGTVTLDEANQKRTITVRVNESNIITTLTDSGETEYQPNLVIVPTWGVDFSASELLTATIEIGEAQEERTFAVIMNNAEAAMPFYGINQADIFFEMLIEGNMTRGLALYSDVEAVSKIGSIRSVRYNFTDLAQAYGAILVHASGSEQVLKDMATAGIENLNADSNGIGSRDDRGGNYAQEHTLFVTGKALSEAAAKVGYDDTAQKDSGLNYAESGNSDSDQAAKEITIGFTYGELKKTTTMKYENGEYQFLQYGSVMEDAANKSIVTFDNVLVLYAETQMDADGYYVATLTGTGTGLFAWGGKSVDIKWVRKSDSDSFTFTLMDGTPVVLGTGNTYVAIVPAESTITCK